MVGEEKSELIFPEGKNHKFIFKGEELILGPIGPDSKTYLQGGMKHLSLDSLRNRFFGGKKEFTSQELERLTALDGKNRFALGLIRDFKDAHGMGLIRMDRDAEDSGSAEVALTIIDEYQRRGLGTILLKIMILAAIERGFKELKFTYLRANSGFEKLIMKFQPLRLLSTDQDSKSVALDLKRWSKDELKKELRPFLPEI